MANDRDEKIKVLEGLQAGAVKPLEVVNMGLWFWKAYPGRDGAERVRCEMPDYTHLDFTRQELSEFTKMGGHHIIRKFLPKKDNNEPLKTINAEGTGSIGSCTIPTDSEAENQGRTISARKIQKTQDIEPIAITDTTGTETGLKPDIIRPTERTFNLRGEETTDRERADRMNRFSRINKEFTNP